MMVVQPWRTLVGLCCTALAVAANLCGPTGPCSCVDKTIDCSKLKLTEQFNATEWNGTGQFLEAKFDVNQLVRIKQFPKLPLVYLSLAHNLISFIEDAAFMQLENLTVLDLSNNFLHSKVFTPYVFKGQYDPGYYLPMKNLMTLRLSFNQLTELEPDLFEHLPRLETLSLDNNPLKEITKSTLYAISSVQSLKFLDLSATELHYLPEFVFSSLKFLSILNLSLNQFKTIPHQLDTVPSLQYLYLDDNSITRVNHFPRLPKLEVLHMNWMSKLEAIGPYSLSNLTKLKEFHCHHNVRLGEIVGTAFVTPAWSGSESPVWPPLTKMYIQNNNLGFLDSNLVGRWDHLEVLNLNGNPWVCECENQWMVEDLIPRIKAMRSPHLTDGIMCHKPAEMRGLSMVSLEEKGYSMRCLDMYGNRPEKDTAILIGVVIGLFFTIPFVVAVLIVYRRRNMTPRHFSRAFYKPADSTQSFVNAMY